MENKDLIIITLTITSIICILVLIFKGKEMFNWIRGNLCCCKKKDNNEVQDEIVIVDNNINNTAPNSNLLYNDTETEILKPNECVNKTTNIRQSAIADEDNTNNDNKKNQDPYHDQPALKALMAFDLNAEFKKIEDEAALEDEEIEKWAALEDEKIEREYQEENARIEEEFRLRDEARQQRRDQINNELQNAIIQMANNSFQLGPDGRAYRNGRPYIPGRQINRRDSDLDSGCED